VTTIKTNWSGSVAGIRDVSQSNPIEFFANDTVVTANGNNLTSSTNPTAAAKLSESSAADIAMTDNYQGTTKFTATTLTRDAIVGVVPFAFVASKNAPAGLTNITSQLARNLFKAGFASASLFTNNAADEAGIDSQTGTLVYAIGRDPFSGTRLTAAAEPGIGVFTVLAQYEPKVVANNTITRINLTNADAATGVSVGDNGYSSGGTLADQLRLSSSTVEDLNNNPGSSQNICFISYLGESDADRAVNGTSSTVTGANAGSARYLSFNGVSAFGGIRSTPTVTTTSGSNILTLTSGTTTGLVVGQAIRGTGIPADSTIASITSASTLTISANATASGNVTATTTNLLPGAIRNGSYTFWGYEHLMSKTLTGDKLTVSNSLTTQIKNVDFFASGLPETSMKVSRLTDGGTVTQKY
jgi:hypothetical protein